MLMNQPLFRDRHDAGQQLAQATVGEISSLPRSSIARRFVVYGLPRGGIPVAEPIAQRLNCPLDIIVAKKVTLPDNPELAIGAVTADGHVIRSRQAHFTRQSISSWRQALQDAHQKARVQAESMADSRPLVNPTGAIAIVVDDGIATGMTMAVAARSLRAKQPAHIFICAPVAPRALVRVLHHWGDRLVILETPATFLSVSRFYALFDQVEMEDAVACLKRQNQPFL